MKNKAGMTHIENITDGTIYIGEWLELAPRTITWKIVMHKSQKEALRRHVDAGDIEVVYPSEELKEEKN